MTHILEPFFEAIHTGVCDAVIFLYRSREACCTFFHIYSCHLRRLWACMHSMAQTLAFSKPVPCDPALRFFPLLLRNCFWPRMTIGTLLPRHSGGKFNLECSAGSELLPLPGVDIGARKEGIPLLFWYTIQYRLEKPGSALSYQSCTQEKLVWELPRKSKGIQLMCSIRNLLLQF